MKPERPDARLPRPAAFPEPPAQWETEPDALHCRYSKQHRRTAPVDSGSETGPAPAESGSGRHRAKKFRSTRGRLFKVGLTAEFEKSRSLKVREKRTEPAA